MIFLQSLNPALFLTGNLRQVIMSLNLDLRLGWGAGCVEVNGRSTEKHTRSKHI